MKTIDLDALPGPHFYREMETAGAGGKASLRSIVLENGDEQPQLLLHDEAAEAEVKAVMEAHNPAPPIFEGEVVLTAEDVDRVTAKCIREIIAPQWEGKDIQMANQAMLRLVEDLLAAVYIIEYKEDATQQEREAARLLLDANWQMRVDQIQALRQKGADFKAARGW